MPTTFANTIDGNDIYAKRAECDAAGNNLSTTYATVASLAPVATSGDFDDLTDKPTVKPLVAGSNITITENANDITIAATGGGGGSYTAGTGIDITNDVISVDTSVVATQTDLADKEDAFDVGTGLEMDTSGATPTLQVEAPVDIVAGPGIVIDNPDGNTLRVSQSDPTVDVVRDCENWNGHSMKCIILRGAYTTNTSMQNQYIENVLPVGTTLAFIDGSKSYVVYGDNPQINMMVPYHIDNNRLFSPWVDITNRRVNLRYIDVSNNITCTYYLCVKYAID